MLYPEGRRLPEPATCTDGRRGSLVVTMRDRRASQTVTTGRSLPG
jgi:hypothetical protein